MYDFKKSQMTSTRESIFRGHWIVLLALLFVSIALMIRVPQDKIKSNPVQIARYVAPVVIDQVTPTVLRNQFTSEVPSNSEITPLWWNWFDDGLRVIERELEPIIRYVLDIPNRHFDDVIRNHHYEGFLPTKREDGTIVQKTPCIMVNLIYPDGRIMETCIQRTIIYE